MTFNREILQQIRDKIDIVELIGTYTRLERRGDRWWGLSPFKAEKTPSFSVKPEDGFYYCFATQQGGDLFRFVSEMEGLSFPDAVRYLAERAGISLETQPEDRAADRERQALYNLYERVSTSFAFLLEEDSRGGDAKRYAEERGLDQETRERFKLGYAPADGKWLYRFLLKKSFSPDFLQKCGLFGRNSDGYSLFRNRLVFPIRDDRGRVIAFGGRALSSEERAKYINSPETLIYNKKRTLYGLSHARDEIRRTRRAYLCEGYMDVIALHQAGITNSLAPLGTSFTEEQASLLSRWADEVVLLFDADSAGAEATFRAAIIAEKQGLSCSAVEIPRGKDPAELLRESGVAAVRDMAERRKPVFNYLLELSADILDRRDPASRELLLRKLFPYISIISSEVRRVELISALGDMLLVNPAAVTADFEKWRRGEQPHNVAKPERAPEQYKTSRDLTLMLATANDGELFAYLRGCLEADDLEDAVARKVYVLMEDAFRHGEALPRGILDRVEDERLRNFLLERLTSGEFFGWTKEDVQQAVHHIRVRRLMETQREIEAQLKNLDQRDQQEIRRILEQKMAVDQELARLKVRLDD